MKETSPKSNNGTILDINESFKIEFDPISDALAAIRNGECIIVVDDERRENEGDLICILDDKSDPDWCKARVKVNRIVFR